MASSGLLISWETVAAKRAAAASFSVRRNTSWRFLSREASWKTKTDPDQPARVIGDGCGTIFNGQKMTVTMPQYGVIGEPNYGAQRQDFVHRIFYRVVRGFTEDRKYLTDLLSPDLFQTCAGKPLSDRVQERNPAVVDRWR